MAYNEKNPLGWSMTELKIGDLAPDFNLPSDRGGRVSLSELKGQGRAVVLYFYPKDDTPGCIIEGCAFRDRHSLFEKAGAVVLGVSSDSLDSHHRFSAKYRLNFPLLADAGGKVCRAYGAQRLWGLVRRRITYVVDAQGRIALAFDSMTDPERHVDEALNALKG